MKYRYLLLGAFILWGQSVYGQIVTSSIDPGQHSETPSAISWRFGSVIALETTYGQREYKTESVASHNLHTSGLFAWQPSQVAIELYSRGSEIIDSVDSSSDTFVETKGSQSYFSVAVRGEGRISVGIIARQNERVSPEKFSVSSFGGSFSVRAFGGFFMAAGLERVSSTGAGETVRWQKTLGGISYLAGDPFSRMLRIELGMVFSPEIKDSAAITRNQETVITKGDVELLFMNTLISYRSEKKVLGSGSDLETTNSARFGLGYRSESFSVIVYDYYGEEIINNKTYFDRKQQLTFSLSFI